MYRLPPPLGKNRFLLRGGGVCTQARRKTSRSKGENQQQTQPTYGVDAEIWTRATLVGGECSYHCTTLALIETWTCAQVDFVKWWPNQNGPWWKPWRNRKDYCYQRWLLSVQTSETSGQSAKSDWMSEHKEGNKAAAFILRIKGLICLQRQNFYYCSRLSACGSRAHLKAGGKKVLRFIAIELCTFCTARQRCEWQYGGREG